MKYNKFVYSKTLLLLVSAIFLFSFSGSAAEHSVSYLFKAAENGETTVLVTIEGEGTVNIPLPKDVVDPEIRGGVYVLSEDGIEVTIDEEGKTQLGYKSSFYTRKESGVWFFESLLKENSTAKLVLPNTVKVVQAKPSSTIRRNSYIELSWDEIENNKIYVSYIIMKDSVIIEDEGLILEKDIQLKYIILAFVIVLIIGLMLRFFFKKKEKKEKMIEITVKPKANEESLPNITDGQMNVIKAANENDALILIALLKHNGKMKRNTLEKEIKLAKSSLASSLNSLEKKNLVGIDRTFHVHYITLSKWFRELE